MKHWVYWKKTMQPLSNFIEEILCFLGFHDPEKEPRIVHPQVMSKGNIQPVLVAHRLWTCKRCGCEFTDSSVDAVIDPG